MSAEEKLCLLADIGGTRARLALYDPVTFQLSHTEIFSSRAFSSISDLLSNYISMTAKKPVNAILALAGPVIGGKVSMTNLQWEVDSRALKRAFNFKKVILVNDLQAIACSVLSLGERDLILLKEAKIIRKYPKAFIAPGTGLGVSVLVSGRPLKTLATEAGHTFFSPVEEEEWEITQFLRYKGMSPVWEEILSGRGLTNLFKFFAKKELTSEEIVSLALEGNSLALKVLSLYLRLLGRKCYELALSYEPFGGIYMAGGLAIALESFFKNEEMKRKFIRGYKCNEKLERLLDAIPIFLILHPNPGLLGVQTIARNLLR